MVKCVIKNHLKRSKPKEVVATHRIIEIATTMLKAMFEIALAKRCVEMAHSSLQWAIRLQNQISEGESILRQFMVPEEKDGKSDGGYSISEEYATMIETKQIRLSAKDFLDKNKDSLLPVLRNVSHVIISPFLTK